MPSTVAAVSVVSAMPVADAQPTPMATAVAAVVSGAHATATPVAAEAATDGTSSFHMAESSIPRQSSEPPIQGDMFGQPVAGGMVPVYSAHPPLATYLPQSAPVTATHAVRKAKALSVCLYVLCCRCSAPSRFSSYRPTKCTPPSTWTTRLAWKAPIIHLLRLATVATGLSIALP
jgi:hypothetical protein